MSLFNRFRFLHWLLAGSFLLAYVTSEEAGLLHAWLGYAVVALVALRVVLWIVRLRGLPPLLPSLSMVRQPGVGLLGRLLTLTLLAGIVGSSVSGMMMVDNARLLTLAAAQAVPAAHADDDGHESNEGSLLPGGERNEWLEETHETVANGTLLLAGLHVAFLLAFRRQMMLKMLGMGDAKAPAVARPQG